VSELAAHVCDEPSIVNYLHVQHRGGPRRNDGGRLRSRTTARPARRIRPSGE